MSLSSDLESVACEYALLLDEERAAKRELRSIQTRRGAKHKRLRKMAELLFVSDEALAEMVRTAVDRRPAVAEPEDDGLCDDCNGTGIVTDELGRDFCGACNGTGDRR